MKAEVKAIEHEDVRGKKLLYIKISNGINDLLINVGQKTYDTINDLDKIIELPLQEPDNKNNETNTKPPIEVAQQGNKRR